MTQFCPICAHGVLLGSHVNSESLTGIDSDGEAFATTASAGDVRVVEDELGGQLCLLVIHLGAQERQLGFLVYIDGHTVLKKQSKLFVSDFMQFFAVDLFLASNNYIRHRQNNSLHGRVIFA